MNTPVPTTANGLFPNIYSTGRQEIIKVNGENGARAYQLAPNCSALLLDENNPIVWLVTTDGAGYKTVTPYSITLYQPEPPIDISDLSRRIKALEEKLNEPDTFTNEFAGDKPTANKANMEQIKSHK